MTESSTSSPALSCSQRGVFWAQLSSLALPRPAEGPTLSAAWLRTALTEHASIASFAKFSLELLALGAPAELLRTAHEAALDEIEHARICFALASHYAGRPLGPGPLPVQLSVADVDLERVTVETMEDGCIGETLAAAEAAAAAALVTEPVIRAALEVIAIDETTHAELAWRFVGWSLGQGDQAVRQAAQRAFERATVQAARSPGASLDDVLLTQYGRIAGAERERARREALEQHIIPAGRTLFAMPPEESSQSESA